MGGHDIGGCTVGYAFPVGFVSVAAFDIEKVGEGGNTVNADEKARDFAGRD